LIRAVSTPPPDSALGKPSAGPDEIAGVLDRVGLGSWLEGLDDGLETLVGEGGSMVSGGQRQRVAAARCLLGQSRFMIFDEPTAHLDPEGALSLERVLVGGRRGGAGILIITHAIAYPKSFDRVLELDLTHSIRERTPVQPD
jgi:ATP-binding cassette subfamily C protein CydCD